MDFHWSVERNGVSKKMKCVKRGGMSVLEWLVGLLDMSFDMGAVPWTSTVHA